MSGRLDERDSRFARMSTSSPFWLLLDCCGLRFWLRHVLRCLFIYEARMTCLHAWQCCTTSLFLTSPMTFSSVGLLCTWCCWIRLSSSPAGSARVPSGSKLMVSTSSKSFQSILLSRTCLATCSFLPLACCCRAWWQSYTNLHAEKMESLSRTHCSSRPTCYCVISNMAVQASTSRVKQGWLLDEGRRNQNCGLFFSRSDSASKKLRPFLAAY